MAWIPLFVAAVLLLLFPKKAFTILAALTLVIISIGLYLIVDENIDESRQSKVDIEAHLDPSLCPPTEPVFVKVTNASDATLTMLKWNLAVYRSGYHSDLNRMNRRYSPEYALLKPLSAGESVNFCYELPEIREDYPSSELRFEAIDKQVSFGG
ncbi:MAG: hypothetical protein DRQ61_05515 [Gammaproteobacteria bacterium]|nr:MAG: hypothetical protein DRQ61_05515 [Gammaproteobacteria bacterium]